VQKNQENQENQGVSQLDSYQVAASSNKKTPVGL